jgi:mono/diheme cytochrome c family protein
MKSRPRSGLGTRDSGLGQRPRPERGAQPPSEWGWGPTSAEKCRLAASSYVVVFVCLLVVSGCRQDMHNQPKYKPLRAAEFFRDGSSARPLVEGTVSRGSLQEDEAFFTGKVGGTAVAEMPFPVDAQVLDRGQERYDIYCRPCHDATGSGKGMVVQRGYRPPPSFHDERLRTAPPGHFFDVMTNGFGAMPDYRAQIAPRDRWAVVAYIRALQLANRATTSDVPGGDPTKVPRPAPGGERRH